MCTRPIEKEGMVYGCRTCDECLKIRRAQWVARMMAERTQHKQALSVTLTYDNETQENRDAAGMFCYADIQAFLRRLRQSARRAGQASGIRFVVAGEQGDRRGRCHWHIVLYSDTDLRRLGVVSRWGQPVTDPEQMMTRGSDKRRCHWSLWGKGFVTFQSADLAEMRYVAWYVVMDQYTAEKSKGTAREGGSINFATGLFRMSKRPAIGDRWLVEKMEALDRKAAVLPNLNLQVPGQPGYWQPNGAFRKKLLWHLVALNQRVLWATGAPAPQWSTLYSSVSDADRRILDGTATEADDDDDDDAITAITRGAADLTRSHIRRQCGREKPCVACLYTLSEEQRAEVGVALVTLETGESELRSVGPYRPPVYGSEPHRYCRKRSTQPEELGHAFPLWRAGSAQVPSEK